MKRNESHWRKRAREVIKRVLAENEGANSAQVRKAISNAYPFGERKYHPYKIWLDEVNIQTGKKVKHPYRQPLRKPKPADPNQGVLL